MEIAITVLASENLCGLIRNGNPRFPIEISDMHLLIVIAYS